MDNDDKIDENSVHKNVLMFLGDELKPLEGEKVSSYNLVAEYEKTRANKNHKVWLLLALCFLGVGLAAFTTSLIIYNSDKKIEINIDTFDDLNLRTLLSSLGRTQALFESASKKKASLIASMEADMKELEQKKENDLFTLKSVEGLTSKLSMRHRLEALENDYNKGLKSLHEKYDELIKNAEGEMNEYSRQLGDYDGNKVSKAREEEAAIDSQKQLHDLEMKNLSENYESQILELRKQMEEQRRASAEAQRRAVEEVRKIYQAKIDLLDPYVKDEHGNQVVSSSRQSKSSDSQIFNSENFKEGLENQQGGFGQVIDEAGKSFDDFDYITGIVTNIPQERDIPSYVDAMKSKAYSIGNSLASKAKELQLENDSLSKVAALYVKESTCDGLVMEDAKNGKVQFFLSENAAKEVEKGHNQAQLKEGRKVLADVVIEASEGKYFAGIDEENQSENSLLLSKVYLVKAGSKK